MSQRDAEGTAAKAEGEESGRGASPSLPSLANDFGPVAF